ncbi:uncharacterized protein LOC124169557 [Ischnura elegans]|uniref:uncharacterized protein LOC124169557 n=1 Tax=Ischnura elegans TaxID=197161 RepID=UPI001ED8B6D8|nr:uncharacterized protein LOC124169557 [Ischnura elegans]
MQTMEMSAKAECLKLLRELNRAISSHRNLALCLGGSGDCEQLRDELKRARRKAQETLKQTRMKLSPYLQDQKLSDRERMEMERLWYLYYCCVCVLAGEELLARPDRGGACRGGGLKQGLEEKLVCESTEPFVGWPPGVWGGLRHAGADSKGPEVEMRRTLGLQRLFALHTAPVGFINTGLHEFVTCGAGVGGGGAGVGGGGSSGGGGGRSGLFHHHHHHHHHHHFNHQHHPHQQPEVLDVPLADRLALENAEVNQLQKEIAELHDVIVDLQNSIAEMKPSWLWGHDDGGCQHHSSGPQLLQQQQQQHGLPQSPSALTYGSDSDAESAFSDLGSQADDSGMTIQQRRCLCWVVVSLVCILSVAAILGITIAVVF